jgi:two-component system sensor histidine kinase BarA
MRRRVLVVDDDRVSRLTTQTVLERLGFTVDVLSDGRRAAHAEATGHFVAIVMDCQMPYMDGFQATAEIRSQQIDSHRARTPIIGLSVRAMNGDEDVAIAKGMDAYIPKPVTVEKMRAALEQVFVPGR